VQLLRELERFEEAVNTFLAAIRISPQSIESRLGLCSSYRDLNRLSLTAHHSEIAYRDSPDDVKVVNAHVLALTEIGDFKRAETVLAKALKNKTKNNITLHNAGILKWLQGEDVSSKRYFLAAFEADDKYHPTMFWLSSVLSSSPDAEVRDGVLSLKLAERLIRESENERLDYLTLLARAYAENGKFDKAVAVLRGLGKKVEMSVQAREDVSRLIAIFSDMQPFRFSARNRFDGRSKE
jgi:tetratricopeptide (TPR) repeat protein